MSLAISLAKFQLLPLSPLHNRATPSRPWKRRRIKSLTVRNQLDPTNSPFNYLFQTLIYQFPFTNTLSYIAPTLGLATGLALYLSSSSRKKLPEPNREEYPNYDVGEWILYASPTPFNRFVMLRCPSICFPGKEMLEDVNEEKHFGKLNSERMNEQLSDGSVGENIVYQRICLGTEDGGVLSLDWPASLEMEEERGLDTTVLIVPGTVDGSYDGKIRVFVSSCLRRGIFPVVMNPRGSAGSPLTTARLFTAADSDDISTAVDYVNKRRSWTTLIGVGWEFGANMMTKYLAECGERTPLMAATCIDNPFDLAETVRSSANHMASDQMHTRGMISILQSNKELFQGRGKGFDVARALSASSVLDFDQSISMISYGFERIEDFYAESSTRNIVGKVKIPVLFIQNDDGTVPLNFVPRDLIAENPYTSLLLCSCSRSNKNVDCRLILSWCQNMAIEWLTAVELGLLKGRHPLLNDVDISINPVAHSEVVESEASNKIGRATLLSLTSGVVSTHSNSRQDKSLLPKAYELVEEINRNGEQPAGIGAETVEEGTVSSVIERGQVVQSAQVVMNMVDMAMPDILSDEQKNKVLSAVGQGQTLINALQDAVPEDVRGKLTTAVSEILNMPKSDLKFTELLCMGHIPEIESRKNSKVLENFSDSKARGNDVHSADHSSRSNDPVDRYGKVGRRSDKSIKDADLDNQLYDESKKPNDTVTVQPNIDPGSNSSGLGKDNLQDMGESIENEQLSKDMKSGEVNVSEVVVNDDTGLSQSSTGDMAMVQQKVETDAVDGDSGKIKENSKHNIDTSTDQNKVSDTNLKENISSVPFPSPGTCVTKDETESNTKNEEKVPNHISNQSATTSPSFDVSQAFDALTGFDDSTQVAVNSVFNVIEGMIDQLEVKNDNGSEVNEMDWVKKPMDGSEIENHPEVNYTKSERSQHFPSNATITQLAGSDDIVVHNSVGCADEQQNCPDGGQSSNSTGTNELKKMDPKNLLSDLPSPMELSAGNIPKFPSDRLVKFPSSLASFPYGYPLQKDLKTFLYSKMSKPLDMRRTSDLLLNYIPEDGQWKLSEDQRADGSVSDEEFTTCENGLAEDQIRQHARYKYIDDTVEPSYAVLDPVEQQVKYEKSVEFGATKFDNYLPLVKTLVVECLNVEVNRRVSAGDIEESKIKLVRDLEHVGDAVCLAAAHVMLAVNEPDDNISKLRMLESEDLVKVLVSAVNDTQYLRRVLPVGVIVGSTLAALRKFFDVAEMEGFDEKKLILAEVDENKSSERIQKKDGSQDVLTSFIVDEGNIDPGSSKNNDVMVGAVTAALGASALLVHQQTAETSSSSDVSLMGNENILKPSHIEEMPERFPSNIITSLAEKAMSVASPMVPTKEDGEVDHQRVVAMLAELGQKGGILKLVGKVALLWGGIRGAMNVTDKLISFFHLAERPLVQRILGFVFMVILLWSPVFVPLLPSLMQSWATHNPFRIAEFACIVGLYVSVMITVTLWGKRMRNYDDPLLQYGLDLSSALKLQNFLMGLVGGATLVILIHSVNSFLGFVHLSWPSTLSLSSSEPILLITTCGRMVMAIIQGIATATAVSVVEELLFRSWLPQEIDADIGYHQGIIISGLLFALFQRSMWEIPGLWLLSLSLAGARERTQGTLWLPIGLRTGILVSTCILKTGGFLTYHPNIPIWITGACPFQPFSGVVGLAFSLLLAIFLYPSQRLSKRKTKRVIRQ